MGTKYSSQATSGYNSTPPSDDGAATEANKVKWSTIKTKLADVLKTFGEAINSALVTTLNTSARAITTSDSAAATDHWRTIQVNTASVTVTLADAATMAAGYIVDVANQSSGDITVALATSVDTIDGVTNTTQTINAKEVRRYIVNAAATGYITAGYGASRPALPPGHLSGLTYSNNGSDATNDIDIAAGNCRDSTDKMNMVLSSALTKRLDAAWAVGTNQGGLDSGAIGNSDYYIWLIKRSDSGVVDALFSLSPTAPTMPANYEYKRLTGWFKRVSNTIVAFHTYETEGGGLNLQWDSPTLDVNLANTLTTARRTDAVKVPLNFSTVAHLNVILSDATGSQLAWIYCPDQTDAAPAATVAPLANALSITSAAFVSQMFVRTSATGTIAARSDLATVDLYAVSTIGFLWSRRN